MLSEDDLRTYRATCRRRDAEEQRRQRDARRAGIEAARRAATLLRETFGAERVLLFGSLARKERLGPRSDLDLVVDGLAPDKYYQAVARVQRVADRPVDLVRIEDCDNSLRTRIEAEGRPL